MRNLFRNNYVQIMGALFLGFASAFVQASCGDHRGLHLPDNADMLFYSGYYVGGDGCFYDPMSVDVKDVPPALGASGDNGKRIYFVNGANGMANREPYFLKLLAQKRDIPAIGVFNAQVSNNLFPPKTDTGGSAVKTLKNLMLDGMSRKEGVLIRAGSAGSTVVMQAFIKARAEWNLFHVVDAFAPIAMSRVKIETFGGIGLVYPDGPQYTHYANENDINAKEKGVLNPWIWPGKGAVIVVFNDQLYPPLESAFDNVDPDILSYHGFGVYNNNQADFELIYKNSPLILPYKKIQLSGVSP